MYLRTTSTPNSPRKSVKVVESVRVGLKVKQIMLHHVGIASTEQEIEKLKKIGMEFIAQEQLRREQLSGQGNLFPERTQERIQALEISKTQTDSRKKGRKLKQRLADLAKNEFVDLTKLVEEQRITEGIHEVCGAVFDSLGYHQLLRRKKDQDLLRDIVLMRIAYPGSKYKTQRLLRNRFSRIHNIDALYRMMDKLFLKIGKMKAVTFNKTQELTPQKMDILFFDCTTLYFESTETDELRRLGYSKDHRFNTAQVVLALATTPDGLPLGYELFEGNKAEVTTLIACVESWKQHFTIDTVCFVADRAMMSKANMKLLEDKGYSYIIAAKLRVLPIALQEEILNGQGYKAEVTGEALSWIKEFSYEGKRLIVSYKAERAKRDQYQREQVVAKIKKILGKEGETEKLITNSGVKRYTNSQESTTKIDEDKINADAAWDGLHGVITNLKNKNRLDIIERYSNLWKIEESFRLNKHTLSIRPIFHFKTERIHAHLAICYMAFSVLRHVEYRVNLRQKVSPQELIEKLLDVQSSVLCDTATQKRYRLPGRFSQTASKIYRALDLVRDSHIKEVV